MGKWRALVLLLLGAFNLTNAYSQNIVDGQITNPLTSTAGDPARGKAIVLSRQTGLCLLCHSGPFPQERFQGNLAPELSGSVTQYTASQLRARIVDASYFNQNTIMPSYYRATGFNRIAPKFSGQTILSAQEIEDVIAFLITMKKTSN